MILQSLYELYQRISTDPEYKVPEPGYSLQKVSFCVVIDQSGQLFEVQDIRDHSDSKQRPLQLVVPEGDKSTGGVTEQSVHKKVRLLRNDLPFLLGAEVEEEEAKSEKTKKVKSTNLEFEAFKKRHLAIEEEIDDEEFSSVCRFLDKWDPKKATDHQEWVEFHGGQGVFQIKGRTHYVHDRKAFRKWYSKQVGSTGDSKEEYVNQCLVTGQYLPISKLHEPKIKKVGISSGALLVSFDKASDAYCSYGRDKQQGYNAPVSKEVAFRYATALNSLLDGPKSDKHTVRLGDTIAAFWTEKSSPIEDIFAQFAWGGSSAFDNYDSSQDEGTRQKIQAFLNALRKGREAYQEFDSETDKTPFFLLGMTGQAKGRIGVRFFAKSSLSALLDNLRRHYNDIKTIRQYDDSATKPDDEFPSAQLLLDQTCPPKKKKPDRDKIPPILSGPLLRAIIKGERYPHGLYAAVIRRIHAERRINHPRACVIKGYLKRNLNQEVSVSLDKERKDPAYRLGRLFAALEKTQKDALGKISSSIRDRFYSAASATPRTVFPRLLRTYQHHLGKMEGGLKTTREKLVQEIMDPLTSFPSHLNLNEQGIFAIGYYHQTKDFYVKKESASEQKGKSDEQV